MFYHQIFRKNLKGFTLIELLVVIAIIAIISSIVLVNLQGTREKARIAKGLEFSQTVHNVLGVNAVGVWSFEENGNGNSICGADICDSSGYGNHGTNTNTDWLPDTPSGQGYALNFDGSSDDINVPYNNNDSLNVSNITIEVWINRSTTYGNGYGTIVGKDNLSQYLVYFDNNPVNNFIYFYICNTSTCNQVNSDEGVPANVWTHVTATYNGSIAKIFFNGVEKNSMSIISGDLNKTTNDLCMGDRCGGNRNFVGLIDEVRIYSQALTSAQIQKHYVDGLKRLELAKD